MGSAWILKKVLSAWREWLICVTDALGAWFAPGWCSKKTPVKTVMEEIITIIINKSMMEFTNLHRVSSSENPFSYLCLDNCALHLTVVAFLLLKGWKIATIHSGTKNSTRKKKFFEDKAVTPWENIHCEGRAGETRDSRKLKQDETRSLNSLNKMQGGSTLCLHSCVMEHKIDRHTEKKDWQH